MTSQHKDSQWLDEHEVWITNFLAGATYICYEDIFCKQYLSIINLDAGVAHSKSESVA